MDYKLLEKEAAKKAEKEEFLDRQVLNSKMKE